MTAAIFVLPLIVCIGLIVWLNIVVRRHRSSLSPMERIDLDQKINEEKRLW